ncbi:MAG: AraC family transcriptional regulator [Treponema sp.]|nr:AraC family transcriptional regulator [Treponema sp.]
MKVRERGVRPESNIYFHIPKAHNRKMFLIPSSSGYFFCDETYRVSRNNYSGYLFPDDVSQYDHNNGSYMFLFVKNGNGYVYQNDRRILLCKNEVFLLNCYHPHCYGTSAGSKLEIVWIHFDGAMVRDYFKEIAKGINCIVLKSLSPSRSQTIYNNIYNVYKRFDKQKGINDIINNKYLMLILTEFLLGNFLDPTAEEMDDSPWDDLLAYISENIQKPLKVAELAERMAMSPYHFIRQFKKEIGYTPHHYVLLARIGAANHFLKDTTLTIKEIAYACGFSSEGSFCNAFKNLVGLWPMAYRENGNTRLF